MSSSTPRALVGNASDEGQVKRAGERVASTEEMARIALRDVLETGAGRRVLWDLLSDCGLYAEGFHPDPHLTAHAAGQRAVGLRLLAAIAAADPDAFPLMQTESHRRAQTTNG